MSNWITQSRKTMACLARDCSATTAIEYAVIAAGIALAIVASVNGVGSEVGGLFASIKGNF